MFRGRGRAGDIFSFQRFGEMKCLFNNAMEVFSVLDVKCHDRTGALFHICGGRLARDL